ncbi:MAG: hypothetical protein WBL27_03815 [Salinimicrobium sp.]
MQKTRLILFALLLCFTVKMAAQQTYIIEGDTLELQREVKGELSLFWNLRGTDYRYFVQKSDRMIELKDSLVNGKLQYKEQLSRLTSNAEIKTHDVKFLLYSLKHFVNTYNAMVQEDYEYNEATANIKQRLGLFVGLSNNKYTENPDNIIAPIVGLEYEFYDPNLAPRHSAFLQLRQSFKREDYRYSATQLSINYRFRALYFKGWDLHLDTELATFLYSEDKIKVRNEAGEVVAIKDDSGFSFTAPFSFGIGSDIRITENSFISLGYNDIFSIVLDGNGSFPLDFTVGLKYNL